MRTFILGTLAALTLCLGVTANASAGWKYRNRIRIESGRRVVYLERYWTPTVMITDPDPILITPLAPTRVVVTEPVYATGYRYRPYRTYHRHSHYVRRR